MQMPSIPSVEPGVKPRNQLESDAPNQSVLLSSFVLVTTGYQASRGMPGRACGCGSCFIGNWARHSELAPSGEVEST